MVARVVSFVQVSRHDDQRLADILAAAPTLLLGSNRRSNAGEGMGGIFGTYNLLHGDRESALSSLRTARQITPQQTRYHPGVAETALSLARAERRRSESVSGFAKWMGINTVLN